MWPLAACQQKSPQEQYKDIPDDQIDAAIVFVDSNYPPDSTTAVVDDVTKMALSGAHVAPTWQACGQGAERVEFSTLILRLPAPLHIPILSQ